jgi:hypothetical protein
MEDKLLVLLLVLFHSRYANSTGEFPLRNNLTSRRQSYCKDCKSDMGKSWYKRNKEYQKENASKHRVEYRQTLREYAWE